MDALPQLHLHDMQSVNATDAARSQHGLFANQSSKNEPKSSDSTALADGWRGSSIDDASTIAASSPEPLISAELPGNEDYGSSSSDGKRESGGINSVIQNTEPALARNTTYQKPGADPPIPIQASSGTRSKPSLSERRSQPGVPSVIDVLVPDPDALKSIWCTYAREAHAFDQRMIESWNKTLDVRLIFAGLFSAILTPFLVESCKLLETRPSPNIFGREGYKVRMNAMWFGSLIFALTAALLCIHCKQWLDGYGVDLVFAGAASGCPESLAKACRLRQYRYQGLHIYKIPSIIDTLPALLYIALSCFVIGLIDFLWQLNEAIAIYISCLCGLVVTFYVGTTLSPCLTTASPYKTPVSRFIGNLVRTAKGGERLEDQEVKDVRDLEESLNESGFQWLMNYSRNEDVHGQAKRAQKEHRRVMGIKHETVAN